jgi:hypothetical protein
MNCRVTRGRNFGIVLINEDLIESRSIGYDQCTQPIHGLTQFSVEPGK